MPTIDEGHRILRDQSVRLSEVAERDTIESVTFDNCVLRGPVVIALIDDVTIEESVITGTADGVLWPIAASRELLIGAIAMNRCVITRCRLEGVGFAVREDTLARVRRGLGFDD